MHNVRIPSIPVPDVALHWPTVGHLAAANRWLGVLDAVVGAVVVAPDGFRLLLQDCRGWLVRRWQGLRGFLARFLPFLRRTVSVTSSAAAVWAAAHGSIGLVGKVNVWTSDAPIDERIELLRQRISDLEGEVSELRDEVRTANAATGKAIANLEASIQQETEALRALLEEERRAAARIDSRGLPLIAAGVFLSGVPDDLARLPWHLGLAVLGLGLLVLVIVAGPLVRRTAKPLGRWLGGADEAAA